MPADFLTWMQTLLSRMRTLLSPRRVDQEFEQELETHLDLLTQENISRGMGCFQSEVRQGVSGRECRLGHPHGAVASDDR